MGALSVGPGDAGSVLPQNLNVIKGAEVGQSAAPAKPMPESLKKAFEFAKSWAAENNTRLQQLPQGKAIKLSRKEINNLKGQGKLSPKLEAMLDGAGLTTSVAIVNMGKGEYRFIAMRHAKEMKSQQSTNAKGKETAAEVNRKQLFEGGVNKLNQMDGSDGVEFLNRQSLGASEKHLVMIQRQKNADDVLQGAPHIAAPLATSVDVPASARELGVKPIKGSIVEKVLDAKTAIGAIKTAIEDNAPIVRLAQPLPAEEGIRYLHHISEAVGYMHDNGMVHRDLKIDNLLFDKDKNCYVADFDTFVDLNNPLMLKSTSIGDEGRTYNELEDLTASGTPHLMAPWISGIKTTSPHNDATTAAFAANEKLEKAKAEHNTSDIRAANEEMYMPADTYDVALMGYMMMTGKYPDHVNDNATRGFGVYVATTKNTLDNVWAPYVDAEDLPPQDTNALKAKSELDTAVSQGYPQELADLIFRGLSSNPRGEGFPTMDEFRDLLSKLDVPKRNDETQ